jgi:hypothetical protein
VYFVEYLEELRVAKPRNDRNQAVTKFCLATEVHRRTEAGRVRTAVEFVAHFFPHDETKATDQLFRLLPNEVRGPVLATWGIRGAKAALKDDDAKIASVVHDALVAGDIDAAVFEDGIDAAMVIDWVSLSDWWSFWRQGKLSNAAIQHALSSTRDLGLIDDKWFLANLQGRGGKLKGTDVLCDGLSKEQVVGWLRKLHEVGDGSPGGVVAALGWDTILAKTAQEALLFALDQFARKVGLAPDETPADAALSPGTDTAVVSEPAKSFRPVALGSVAPGNLYPSKEPTTLRHAKLAEAQPTVSAPSDAVALAEAEALAVTSPRAASEAAGLGDTSAVPHSEALPDELSGVSRDADPLVVAKVVSQVEEWEATSPEESPKLAEARSAVLQAIGPEAATPAPSSATPHAPSSSPPSSSPPSSPPSALDWPSPSLAPPVTTGGQSSQGPTPIPSSQPALGPSPFSRDDVEISIDDDEPPLEPTAALPAASKPPVNLPPVLKKPIIVPRRR